MSISIIVHEFREYMRYMLNRSPHTIREYTTVIKLYTQFSKIETIDQVSTDSVRAFLMHGRVERNWQSSTFINFYRALNVFFVWCIRQKYMGANPLLDIQLPKREKKLPPKLTKQDAIKLLEIVYNYPYGYRYLRFRNHAIFAMFIFAGLRKSELLQLRFTDVDMENRTLFIHQGKGGKDRIVPITFPLAVILERYIAERKRLSKTCPQFFASLNLDVGFTSCGLTRLVAKITRASRIPFSIHKLRHTFATLMLEGGCDIYSLSKMMGHSDIKTTTIYLAASTEHLQAQANKHPLNNIVSLRM